MTFDPVHFEGVTRHADRIGAIVDERDQQQLAKQVWQEFLDPLVDPDGRTVLEPIGDQQLHEIEIETAALQATPYETVHGLDSGTINPTAFKNGLVLDVAQAAMAAVPSDLELHRERTLITAVHTDDPTGIVDRDEQLDAGYVYSRLLSAPPVPQFEESVVHELALYIAESTHALAHADSVDELFVLDGPIYPKGMLNWADRSQTLEDLLYESQGPQDVIEQYLRLVERFVETDRSLLGFVKNPSTKALTRALGDRIATPWVDDTGFFIRLLERVDYDRTVDEDGEPILERTRRTDQLTYTNWFRSRGGADRLIVSEPFGIDRQHAPTVYEVTFFMVYDPRTDLLYRIEAPYGITRKTQAREELTQWILSEVAAQRGPPEPVQKADELAGISRTQTSALREALADAFETDPHRTYDDHRWGESPTGD